MTTLPRRALRAALLICASLALAPATAAAGSAGKIDFAKPAESNFDAYTQAPSTTQQAWMRDKYSRMRTYSPYFDSRLSWYPNAWSYIDAYAIYRGKEAGLEQYILTDSAGNRLYIPFACSGGVCTQYAADIGDPGWRRHYIDSARAQVAKGYKGIFVDDVNLAFKVSNGSGTFVAPRDERTGTTMTHADWQRYWAEFMEQLRAELPSHIEIIQNQVYYDVGLSSPYVKRAIEAATHIEIERGVIDTGITGGSGTWGYETVLAWAEYAHSRGKGVVWDAQATWGREYAMATHFLVANGLDGFSHPDASNPDNWWSGYETDLGQPLGQRYSWNGVFRRDFERGIVLVNQPGQTTKSLSLGANYTTLAGTTVSSVSIAARDGKVLLRDAAVPPPSDTTPPETTLTGGPVGTVEVSTADFTFTMNEAGGSFECRLDGAAWAACSSPKSLSGLSEGSHTFEVRAKDAAGNLDPTPAARTWTVASPPPPPPPTPVADTTPPDTTISGGPVGSVTQVNASFTLASSESGSTFECRLDGAAWSACSSSVSLSKLALGSHTFEARARDAAGNVDPTPATRTWSILPKPGRGRKATSTSPASSTSTEASLTGVVVEGRLIKRAGVARGKRARVRVTLQVRGAHGWSRVRSRSVGTRAGGRFSVMFKRMPAARYRVRVRPSSRAKVRLAAGMPRLVRL